MSYSSLNELILFFIKLNFLISNLNYLLEANYKSAAAELLNASCHDL